MSSIKKNFLYNSAYQILHLIIPIITTPYISRVIGPTGIGIYSLNNSIAYYFVIFTMLGLNNYGTREIVKAKTNRTTLSKTFWNIYALQVICGVIVNVAYACYVVFFAEEKIVALVFWFYVISASFDINWFFQGLEQFKLTVIRNTIIKLLSTASIFLLVRTTEDVVIYCLILSLSFFVSHVALWPFVKRYVDFCYPEGSEVKKHIKPNLTLFITVIAVSLFKIMDKIMLGVMTTKAEVGLYEAAERVIQIPTILITALGTVMLPRVSSMVANYDKSETALTYKSIIFAMFLSSSMSFGLMGVAKQFVPLFYGDGFEKCVYLFWILLPTTLFLAFANVIRTQYLLPHNKDKVYVLSAIFGALTNIALNLVLIPHLGSVGAAVGTIVAEGTVCVYQSYKVKNCLPVKKYVRDAIPFVLGGLGMFVLISTMQAEINYIEMLCIKVIFGIVSYLIITGVLLYFMNKQLLSEIINGAMRYVKKNSENKK